MKNFNEFFKFKELVKTFDYSTSSKDRKSFTSVSFNGRHYVKFGTLQAVTFVGNLYKTNNNYILVVGKSRQHPQDKLNKKVGFEVATINTLENPTMIIEVDSKFNQGDFNRLCKTYIDSMNLSFVQTAKEKEIVKNGGSIV